MGVDVDLHVRQQLGRALDLVEDRAVGKLDRKPFGSESARSRRSGASRFL